MYRRIACTVAATAALLAGSVTPALADGDSEAHQDEVAFQMARDACYGQHFDCQGVTIFNLVDKWSIGQEDHYEFQYYTECGLETYRAKVDHWSITWFPGFTDHYHTGSKKHDDHDGEYYGCTSG
jgi:hypothetical protein